MFVNLGLSADCWTSAKKYFVSRTNTKIEVALLRSRDIPRFVAEGTIDAGITTHSTYYEAALETQLKISKNLGLTHYKLVLAAPEGTDIANLHGATIATSHPGITKKYFRSRNIPVNILEVQGCAETYPLLGRANAIVDISETGKSLEENNLQILDIIFEAQAILLVSTTLSTDKQAYLTQLFSDQRYYDQHVSL